MFNSIQQKKVISTKQSWEQKGKKKKWNFLEKNKTMKKMVFRHKLDVDIFTTK